MTNDTKRRGRPRGVKLSDEHRARVSRGVRKHHEARISEQVARLQTMLKEVNGLIDWIDKIGVGNDLRLRDTYRQLKAKQAQIRDLLDNRIKAWGKVRNAA